KKIFKYLKGQPNLGLWYPQDSPFQLEAYIDSDYAGSHGDRKSTTGGCQFLGRRLISWQCKKQTIVATSSIEAEYVAAASCYNQSTICIVKNPVFHQRTKHIEISHHFIRDANEKNLIQVLKIYTDDNVADLLTKAFDGPRFEFLVVHIGMLYIIPAGCFVLAGSYGLCWWLRVPAGRHTSAGGFISTDADDGLDLWRDVNMLCQSLYANDVEEFWLHVLDLTNGKTVYMFMGSSYTIRATLLKRMLRHRLTVPPSYCRHVRVGGIVVGTMAGTIIRTVQADLLQATMPVSSAPMS
nr:putative ribonuclease H-like domain-containing protein [Tanacetum cinerariifolium]